MFSGMNHKTDSSEMMGLGAGRDVLTLGAQMVSISQNSSTVVALTPGPL